MIQNETNIARGSWLIGSSFTLRVLLTSNGKRNGTPAAMTGYSLKFVLRRKPTDTTALLSYETGGSGITLANGVYPPDDPFSPGGSTGGTNDMAEVAVSATDNAVGLIQPGVAYWALYRTDGSNDRQLAWGTVFCTETARQ